MIVANNNKYRFFKKEKKKYFPRKKQFQISSISYRDTTSLNSNRSRSTATGTIVGGSGGGGGGGGSPHPRSPSTDATTDRSEKSVHLFDVSTFDPAWCFSIREERVDRNDQRWHNARNEHARTNAGLCYTVCAPCVTLKYSSAGYVWLILYESMAVRGRRFSISRLAFVTWAAISVDTY